MKQPQKAEIEEIISKLSREGKAKFIVKNVSNAPLENYSKEALNDALEFCLKKISNSCCDTLELFSLEEFDNLARISEYIERPESAIAIYKKVTDGVRYIHPRYNSNEEFEKRKEICYSGIDFARNQGFIKEAEELFDEYSAMIQSFHYGQMREIYKEVVQEAIKLQLVDKARRMFKELRGCYWSQSEDEDVAVIAKELGLLDEMKEIYSEAMLKYEKKGDFIKAAEIAEKLGNQEKYELYKKINDLTK